MSLSELQFPDFPREQLRTALRSKADVPAHHLDEIVDLACHAAASARSTMIGVIDHAPDPRIKIVALGLAAGLLTSDVNPIVRGLEAYATEAGIRTTTVTIGSAGS